MRFAPYLVATIYSKRLPCLNFAVYIVSIRSYLLPRRLDALLVYYSSLSIEQPLNSFLSLLSCQYGNVEQCYGKLRGGGWRDDHLYSQQQQFYFTAPQDLPPHPSHQYTTSATTSLAGDNSRTHPHFQTFRRQLTYGPDFGSYGEGEEGGQIFGTTWPRSGWARHGPMSKSVPSTPRSPAVYAMEGFPSGLERLQPVAHMVLPMHPSIVHPPHTGTPGELPLLSAVFAAGAMGETLIV